MDIHHSPRLFVEADLGEMQSLALPPEQSHYLKNVMRVQPGEALRFFNGRDGEWSGTVAAYEGKGTKAVALIDVAEQTKRQIHDADLWLFGAPIKKTHFDFMIEKATELGVSTIQPILTARTQIREVNVERLRALAIESAEQSERLSIPDIRKPVTLKELVTNWPADRALIVCAEWGEAKPVREAFQNPQLRSAKKSAIVIGPEGGFAAEELDMLRGISNAVFVRLGPRILRADTAAIATLACWQAINGDWNANETIADKND